MPARKERLRGYRLGRPTGERVLPHQLERRVHLIAHECRYEFAATFAHGSAALDAGCGTGYGTYLVADRAASVLGIDISPEAIEYASSVFAHPHARYEVMDGCRLSLPPASFDLAMSFEVIEHLERPERYLAGIRAALRSSGTLLISTPNRERSIWVDGRPANPTHVTEYRADEFRALLERAGFSIRRWYGQRSGERTLRVARSVSRVASRLARLERGASPGDWPSAWRSAAVSSLAPLLGRASWRSVRKENEVREVDPSDADFFVVVAGRD